MKVGVGGWGDGKGVERTGEQPAALLKSVVFYRVFFLAFGRISY